MEKFKYYEPCQSKCSEAAFESEETEAHEPIELHPHAPAKTFCEVAGKEVAIKISTRRNASSSS